MDVKESSILVGCYQLNPVPLHFHFRICYKQPQNPSLPVCPAFRRLELRIAPNAAIPGLSKDLWAARRDLDVRLAVAEMESVHGLQPPPRRFPAPSGPKYESFPLRRVEATFATHLRTREEAVRRRDQLKQQAARRTAAQTPWPADAPELAELASLDLLLAELGAFPRRPPWTDAQRREARAKAESKVEKDGPVRIFRPLLPDVDVILGAPPAAAAAEALEARRRVLAKLRFYVTVRVNGQVVGRTEDKALMDDFTLDVQERLSLRLVRWPDRTRVEIYQRHFPTDILVSEFPLGIPGLNGAAPADARPRQYQFSSSQPYRPPWTHPTSSPAPALQGASGAPASQPPALTSAERLLYTSGSLHVQCRWVPEGGEDAALPLGGVPTVTTAATSDALMTRGVRQVEEGTPGGMEGRSLMPPLPNTIVQYVTSKGLSARALGINRQRLAEELVQGIDIDPNDWRNTSLLQLLHLRQHAVRVIPNKWPIYFYLCLELLLSFFYTLNCPCL